jgi:hypothetical protein
MLSRRAEDDWDDDDDEDADDDSWDSADDFSPQDDEEATVPCRYCGRSVHEEAQRCPHCAHYLSEEDAPSEPRPWWFIVGILLCLLVAALWVVGG